jgi:PST family polysaccharide transporter
VFWASGGIGLALAGVLALAAPLLAAVLTESSVAPVLRALSPVLLLAALCTVPAARLQKQGRFAAFALSDVASTLVGMGVALWGATHGWGAWSLVAQQVVLWTVKFLAGAALSRLPLPTGFRPGLLAPHARFGLSLMGANLVTFAMRNLDGLLVGAVAGVKALGLYAMAVQFMRVPEMVLSGPVYTSLFPTVAASAEDRATIARLWVGAIRVMVMIAAPAMVGLAMVAAPAADLFLGPRWTGLAAVLSVLAPAGALLCLLPINAAVLVGLGRSDVQLRLSGLITGLYLTGVALGLPFGVQGVAYACAVSSAVAAWPSFRITARTVGVARPGFRAALFPPVAASVIMGLAVGLVEAALASRPPALALAAAVAAGVVTYAAALLLLGGAPLRRDIGRLRSVLVRRRALAPGLAGASASE